MKTMYVIAAVLALSTPALSQSAVNTWRAPLPPAEYDRPYPGQLIVTKWRDYNLIRYICSETKPPAVACSVFHHDGDGKPTSCLIMLGPKVWDNERAYRHELGHCNGWPSNHPGAIP